MQILLRLSRMGIKKIQTEKRRQYHQRTHFAEPHVWYAQRSFIFWDDLFSVDKQRVMELCEKILDQHLDIHWVCLVRLNTIDAEMLSIMKKAGCTQIQIGIESGNDRILGYIGKNLTLSQIRAKIPMIRRSGLEWLIFSIVGFPTESEKEIEDTLRLISEIKPSEVGMSIFAPYPGTEFYHELQEKGLLDENTMKSDTWYPYNNFTLKIPDERFVKIAIHALEYADRFDLRRRLGFSSVRHVLNNLSQFQREFMGRRHPVR